ncbi:MAG: chorismate mutase [Spirochaetales bacterium]|nr:chorismate mutase [Spirochaetales bacterium]
MHEIPVYSTDLTWIALRLEGLEETIIYHLIERIQFCNNSAVYEAGKSGFEGEASRSLLDIRLMYHESMDARFGRFEVPEERPFNANLPHVMRKVNLPDYPIHLEDFDTVNLTNKIKQTYIAILPVICRSGDDGQYGSSVEHDVYTLQAISRRIHYGALFVAESKYITDPGRFDVLIDSNDTDKIMEALTRKEVEEKIIRRIREKVEIAQSKANRDIRILIDPETIVGFYRDTIIPLTKEGELLYLLNRKR